MKRPKIEDFKTLLGEDGKGGYWEALEEYADWLEGANEELINEARKPDTVTMPLSVYADKLKTIDMQDQQIKELKEKNKEWKNYAETKVKLYKQIRELKEEVIQWNELAIAGKPFSVDNEGCKKRIAELNKH